MTDTRWRLLLFSAALLVRLVSCLGAAIFGSDSGHYLLMADWMREGRMHDALSVAYHPLYPLLIAATSSLTSTAEQAGNLVSMSLGSAAVLPLYSLAAAVFGRPAAAIAGLMYAFSPAIVEVQSDVMTEGTFHFFLFSSAWLTWRMTEAPTVVRGGVLGLAAAGAFLTRPEGLLAIGLGVAWPLLEVLRRRTRVLGGLGAVGVTAVVIVLVVSPYLLWVKSERGRWGLSVRPSAISAEQSAGVAEDARPRSEGAGRSRLYAIFATSLFRLSLYGLFIPFYALGIRALRGIPLRNLCFYFSFPLLLFAGVLFTLREHTFMSERYLLAGMAMLGALAGLGMASVAGSVLRRHPESRLAPIVCQAVLLLLVVAPAVRGLKLRRQELRSYPAAGRWILDHGPRPKSVIGLEQVAYYCGSRSYYAPSERGPLLAMLEKQPTDYIVYSDKDVRGRPEYVAMLRSLERLEPASEVEGPPGTWKVYIHRVK